MAENQNVGCEHCKHYHDWPLADDQEEPNGDPGDGLGVQGYCCDCDADQLDEVAEIMEIIEQGTPWRAEELFPGSKPGDK